MSNDFIQKILRLFIGVMAFMCCINIIGLSTREAHQYIWVLVSYILFALLLKNIWLTLFVWLTVFLYSFFKFHGGEVYLTNIFAGCIIFYITKIAFEKKHIDYFINIVLWVLVANILYGILQVLDCDFVYKFSESSKFMGAIFNSPFGFMSNTSIMASFIALCIPLIASRKGQFSTIVALILFPMFIILHSSTTLISAIIALLFIIFYKYSRKIFIISTILFTLIGTVFFVSKIDSLGTERLSQWKLVLQDTVIHPVTGWGLDSFRNFNERKKMVYGMTTEIGKKGEVVRVSIWDNPHNLLLSLQYEFGFIAIILLGGYIRQCIIWFRQSDKSRNVIALAGFIICFFIVSIGHFPAFLARIMIIAVPLFGLYEVSTRN